MISICRPTCSSFLRIYNIFIEMVQAHGWHHFKLVSRSIKVMKCLFFVLMNKPRVVSKVHKTDYLSRNKILKQPYSFSTFINDLLIFLQRSWTHNQKWDVANQEWQDLLVIFNFQDTFQWKRKLCLKQPANVHHW